MLPTIILIDQAVKIHTWTDVYACLHTVMSPYVYIRASVTMSAIVNSFAFKREMALHIKQTEHFL